MIPPRFDYIAPTTLEEALAVLSTHGEDAKVLSGGQSLIPLLKLRLASPAVLVDINRIAGLGGLEEADGRLRIGALVRESAVETSDLVRLRYPILMDTARVIADPLVRNLATLCGNLAHGDPANDHPATMLALGAEVVARSASGERVIAVTQFFTGVFTTALRPDEIVTEIRVPAPAPRSGGAYLKLERKVGDFATAAVAVQVTLAADASCARAGVGLTNVGPMPLEAVRTEQFLAGKPLDDATIQEAGRLAAEEAQPTADRRGSAEYKRDLVRVFTMRALRRARDRAEGRAAAPAELAYATAGGR